MTASRLTKAQRANLIDWIHALESGQYEQGPSYLAKFRDMSVDMSTLRPVPTGPIAYCCWGVAGEIGVAKHQCSKELNADTGTWRFNVVDDSETSTATPPTALRTMYGISNEVTQQLMAWNDAPKGLPDHKDFQQIASFLRRRYEITD